MLYYTKESMEEISLKEFEELLSERSYSIVYYGQEDCGACNTLLQEDHLVCYEQNQTPRKFLRIPEKAATDSWVLTGDNQLYAISS